MKNCNCKNRSDMDSDDVFGSHVHTFRTNKRGHRDANDVMNRRADEPLLLYKQLDKLIGLRQVA